MLKSSLCDYSNVYIIIIIIIITIIIIIKRTISIANTAAAAAATNNEKKVIFKNCVPITACISEIDNTQIDSGKDIDNRIQW